MLEEKGRVFAGKVNPAVLAIWAALIVVSKFIPAIPMIGIGASFRVSIIMFPLAGILFGPVSGMIIAMVGGILSQLLGAPAWMGPPTFLVGVVSAGTAGYAVNKKAFVPLAVLILGGVLWYTHPIGREVTLFPIVFYGFGILSTVICAIWGNKLLGGDKQWGHFISIFAASVTGMICSAAMANYFGGLVMHQLPSTVWSALTFQAPIERIVFSTVAAILGVSLFFGLPKIGLQVGPKNKKG